MAGLLDSKLRRFLFNPNKILKSYINKNMPALDFGCGQGAFTIEIANLLIGTGRIISVDMQEEMLEIEKFLERTLKKCNIELVRQPCRLPNKSIVSRVGSNGLYFLLVFIVGIINGSLDGIIISVKIQ